MPKVGTSVGGAYWKSQGGEVELYLGDVLEQLRRMPSGSVQCAVTSPPYWGLRAYATGDGKHLEIGSEKSPDCLGWARGVNCADKDWANACHVCRMVLVFRELRRVLRDDGTLWVNYGDTYSSGNAGFKESRTKESVSDAVRGADGVYARRVHRQSAEGQFAIKTSSGLPSGNLVGVPWRVALALQADGWILRSDIPWVKRSAMPESVRNRPAKALEYVFLLVKKMGYHYDCEAVRKVTARTCVWNGDSNDYYRSSVGDLEHTPTRNHSARMVDEPGARNWRNADLWFQSVETPHGMTWVDDEVVGLDVTSQSYEGAHFATFGSKLIEPMIRAGTSEKGACAKCGAPWKRVVETKREGEPLPWDGETKNAAFYVDTTNQLGPGVARTNKTVGWEPTCECHGRFEKQQVWVERPVSVEKTLTGGVDAPPGQAPHSNARDRSLPQNHNGITGSLDGVERPIEKVLETRTVYIPSIPLDEHSIVPCIVLDPFMGSGTTALVSLELGLRAWGIELSKEYMEQHAIKRVKVWLLNHDGDCSAPSIPVTMFGEEG